MAYIACQHKCDINFLLGKMLNLYARFSLKFTSKKNLNPVLNVLVRSILSRVISGILDYWPTFPQLEMYLHHFWIKLVCIEHVCPKLS